MYSTELLTQTLISGVMIGVLYALMALGITFIYSIVRMINWAMGEFYMLGSYIQYVVVAYALGRNLWWLAVIISTAGTFLFGYLIEPILIKPMHARPMERRDDYATVVTIALLLMLRSLAVALGGPYQYRPETNLPIMWVGPLPMEGARVAASVCALLALALFYFVISKTWVGLALRAAAQNRVAAQTSGVEGVTKRYGGLLANDRVAVTLAAGEIRGLIGPNGAGKTTFVNLVTGIESPDAGEVHLANVSITGLAAHMIAARGLVRSFQVARVFGNLTVRENLMVPYFASAHTRGTADAVARMSELLRLSTLEPLADDLAKSLSGGQRMLLQACAGFMIPDMKVHVLDEPFAGINPVVKDTLIELILKENQTGATFLSVSHEMDIN